MSDQATFTPKAREIFAYNNGKAPVAADPLVIEGRLRVAAVARGTTIDKVIASANLSIKPDATEDEQAEAYQSTETLCAIATEVFGLKLAPYTAEALGMETEPGEADMTFAIAVVDHFYRFLEKKNQPTDSRPGSTPSTASISGTPPTTNMS